MHGPALPPPANGIGTTSDESPFVAGGNHGKISPVVKAQGDSLQQAGIDVSYFLIKGKGIRGYIRQIRPLHLYCKEHSFDLIHAHYSYSAYVASLAGVSPLVVSLMGSDVKASPAKAWLICIATVLFRWRNVIVKSKSMASDLRIRSRVHVVPNGVDMGLFSPMDKNLCRERQGWENGFKHILFPANPTRPEKDFQLARASIDLLDLPCRVHVFDHVEHKETVFHYNASDVVLLTSKWEGSPNVIKEAMACGCPIVSVDVGDVRERIEGVNGCFVAQTRSPEELAALLKEAFAFEGQTEGRDAIFAAGLSNDVIVSKLKDIYDSAIND